jgi:UDP-N-acetylglucosamine--N-acetylmuramyl-(pentapeptide) pyrophosphoryl-undecaprenol N-acetylglucosamine transferase
MNEMAVRAWGLGGPTVVHQTGERDFPTFRPRVERDGYVMIPSTDDFGELLRAADIAVSRAGGTVWELAAAGTPAILVPYPHATADHQTLNARHFERGGGAIVVPDAEIDRVPVLVDELLAAPERLAAMRDAMLRLARPGAADVIADELVALAGGAR